MAEPKIHQDCIGREEKAVEHLAEHDAVSYSQFEELQNEVHSLQIKMERLALKVEKLEAQK